MTFGGEVIKMGDKNNYRRTTATTTVSLPVILLDKFNETLQKDPRFKTRSKLAEWLFTLYIKDFESKHGEKVKE